MIRSVFSVLGLLFRVILVLALIAGLFLVAFVAYRGYQPMPQAGADGMTYWQFNGTEGNISDIEADTGQMGTGVEIFLQMSHNFLTEAAEQVN